jgi:PAS domain-containing protein
MGQFYDLFEKPEYKAAYLELNKHILQNNIPVIMDLNDENISCRHMSGAPIKVDGKHIATWILCAYDDEDYIKMKDILDAHWLAATMFSNYIYTNKIVSNEATRSKSVEMLLEEKVRRQQVLTEALNAINDDDDETINGVLTKAGSYLDVDVMAIYARQPDGSYDCSHLWSKDNIMTAEEYLDNWKKGRTNIQNKMIENGILMVDGKHPNKEYLAAMGEANIKSFICMPLEVNSILAGCLVIASVRKPKEWSDDEVEFVRDIRMVVQGILTRIEGDGNIRAVNQLLIDTYNYLMVGIFIRDNETGEVLFSNQALNTMLGYDFKGKDSKILMQDLRDRFRGVRVVEKPFITERKEISWRSYIRQFDKIMDLTEVSMKWLDGRNASLVILRDVKD